MTATGSALYHSKFPVKPLGYHGQIVPNIAGIPINRETMPDERINGERTSGELLTLQHACYTTEFLGKRAIPKQN